MPIASAGAGGGMGGLGGMAGLGDPAEAEIQKVVSKALDDVAKTTTDELESGGSERSADRRSMSACVLAADVPRPSLH